MHAALHEEAGVGVGVGVAATVVTVTVTASFDPQLTQPGSIPKGLPVHCWPFTL